MLPVKVQVSLAGASRIDNVAIGLDPKRSGSATPLCLVVVRCPRANGIMQTATSRIRQRNLERCALITGLKQCFTLVALLAPSRGNAPIRAESRNLKA